MLVTFSLPENCYTKSFVSQLEILRNLALVLPTGWFLSPLKSVGSSLITFLVEHGGWDVSCSCVEHYNFRCGKLGGKMWTHFFASKSVVTDGKLSTFYSSQFPLMELIKRQLRLINQVNASFESLSVTTQANSSSQRSCDPSRFWLRYSQIVEKSSDESGRRRSPSVPGCQSPLPPSLAPKMMNCSCNNQCIYVHSPTC